MADEIARIKVKPGMDAETGEPYFTWHPSAFRRAIPAEGMLVPLDLYTRRMLKDGSWLEVVDEPAAAAPAAAPKSSKREPSEA
jgi:hypothetical protein